MMSQNRSLRIVLAVASLGLSFSAGRTIIELWQRRDVVRVREQEIATLEKTNASLRRTLKDAGGDAYVEREARDKLGMIKEGETIVMLPEGGASDSDRIASLDAQPTWKKWFGMFY